MASIRDNMQKITKEIIEGFNTGNIDLLMNARAPECTQLIMPKSLGRSPLTNEQFKTHVSSVYQTITGWTFIADNILYDEKARKSAFHATAEATSPIGPFANEYTFFLWFDETGEKITKIEEMVDSGRVQKYFAAMKEHRAGNDAAAQTMLSGSWGADH